MTRHLPALLVLLCLTPAVFADVPPEQRPEVEHLLDFVEHSGCTIHRNGDDHPATEAREHILKKYDYFRDRIRSTEDFIEYSASRSTLSGRDYTVTCPGKATIPTRTWLRKELQRYRQANRH